MSHTLNHAEVNQYMSRVPVRIGESDSVKSMLQSMQTDRVSALPVMDSVDRCVGIVSLSDLARRVCETEQVLENEYPHYDDCLWATDLIQERFGNEPVKQLMTEVVMTVSPDTTMQKAAELLLHNQIHHLPIVSSGGQLVGIISTTDFVRYVASM